MAKYHILNLKRPTHCEVCFSVQKQVYFRRIEPNSDMTKGELKRLLRDYKRGVIDEGQVAEKLASLQPESIGFATVDHHRELRQGFPEVILCQGKTPAQVAEIAIRITREGGPLLATRAGKDHFSAVKKKIRS